MKLLSLHDAERLKEDKNGNFYTDGAYNLKQNKYYIIYSFLLEILCGQASFAIKY